MRAILLSGILVLFSPAVWVQAQESLPPPSPKASATKPAAEAPNPDKTPDARVLKITWADCFSSGPISSVYRSRREVLLLAGVVGMNAKVALEKAADLSPAAGEALLAVELRRLAVNMLGLVEQDGPIVEASYAAWCREKAAETKVKAGKAEGEKKAALLKLAHMLEKSSAFYVELQLLRAVECKERNLLCRFYLVPECVDPCDVAASDALAIATCERSAQMIPQWMPVFGKPFELWTPELAAQLGGTNDTDAHAATAWLRLMRPVFEEAHGKEWTESIYSCKYRRTKLWLIGCRINRCGIQQFYGERQKFSDATFEKLLTDAGESLLENQKALEEQFARTLPNCSMCRTGDGLTSVTLELEHISSKGFKSALPALDVPCCGAK